MAKTSKAKIAEEGTTRKSGQEVAISTLGTLQLFKYKGHTYTKRRSSPGSVVGLALEGDKLITLSPDTPVTPI